MTEPDSNRAGEKNSRTGVFTVIWRAALTFVIVTAVGIVGIIRHRNASEAEKREKISYPVSKGFKETVDPDVYPSKSALLIDGTRYDVTRDYTAEPLESAISSYTGRKLAEGWNILNFSSFTSVLPEAKWNAAAEKSNLLCFLSEDRRKLEGVMVSKLGGGSKITRVSFPLDSFTGNTVRTEDSGGAFDSVPPEYLAVMPGKHRASLVIPDKNVSLFTCELRNTTLEASVKNIRNRLKINGWEKDLPETAAAIKPSLLQNGRMLSAVKGGASCNILLTKQKGNVYAAFRFSKLKK